MEYSPGGLEGTGLEGTISIFLENFTNGLEGTVRKFKILKSFHSQIEGTAQKKGIKKYGYAGYRSRYLSLAKRALYHLSYTLLSR